MARLFFCPVALFGLLSLLSLRTDLCDVDEDIVRLVPAATSILCTILSRLLLFFRSPSHHTLYFNSYYLFATLCNAAVLVIVQLAPAEVSLGWEWLAIAAASWLAVQAAILLWSHSIFGRDTWESAIAGAKCRASRRPQDKNLFFASGLNRNRVLPPASQYALPNMGSRKATNTQTRDFVRVHIGTVVVPK